MPGYQDRHYFYKYVTKDVTKLIIKDHKLRWSCPLDFNDPFDHQCAFIDEGRIGALSVQLLKRIQEYVWDRDDIEFDTTDDPFGFALLMTKFKQLKDKVPREELLRDKSFLQQMIDAGKQALGIFNEQSRLFLLQTRVMCVAEENDNLLMWSHYSEAHTGAVFKLNAIKELDVDLLAARKVEYSTEYPVLATEEEWVDHLCCIKRLELGKRRLDLFYVKSKDWSYEKEWRVSITSEDYPLNDAVYYAEPPEVFGAVYLGCRMPQEDKEQIMELADQSLPNMEIWQAAQGERVYKIQFERLR
jgi:hypothetical protein